MSKASRTVTPTISPAPKSILRQNHTQQPILLSLSSRENGALSCEVQQAIVESKFNRSTACTSFLFKKFQS